jgi:copper chaperone
METADRIETADRMETADIAIEGMTCEGCVKSVTRTLQAVPGVERVEVSLDQGRAKVAYDPGKAHLADLKRAVKRAGYEAP